MRLIDADALERMGYVLTRTYQQDAKTMVYETKKLSDVPTAQLERKTGKWSRPFKGDDELYYETCNKCGRNSLVDLENNFCKNCGADMRGNHNG